MPVIAKTAQIVSHHKQKIPEDSEIKWNYFFHISVDQR